MKIKKNIVISIWKMLWLSFYTPCKTSLKMSKIIREIFVQVGKIQGTFFSDF